LFSIKEFEHMTLHLNHSLLRADIRALSAEIRALKRVLRTRWHRPMSSEQRLLAQLGRRATELCALRALSRGKLHLRKAPRGAAADWNAATYHERIAARLAPSYTSSLAESA
jgi:hypothetical protein